MANKDHELNSHQLDQVSGGRGRFPVHPQPHFRNPDQQLAFELQGQFTAANNALSGFKLPGIY